MQLNDASIQDIGSETIGQHIEDLDLTKYNGHSSLQYSITVPWSDVEDVQELRQAIHLYWDMGLSKNLYSHVCNASSTHGLLIRYSTRRGFVLPWSRIQVEPYSGGSIKGRRRRAPPLIENQIPDSES